MPVAGRGLVQVPGDRAVEVRTLETLDAIATARERIEGNVAPALALEAMLVSAVRDSAVRDSAARERSTR